MAATTQSANGHPITDEMADPRPGSPQTPKPQLTSDAETKRKKKLRIILLSVLVALLVAGGLSGGLASYFIKKNKSESSTAESSSPTPTTTPDIINNQTGTFNSSVARKSLSQTTFTYWIPFAKSFSSPPDVILNLQKMDMLPGASTISIDTLSSNITQQGFTVQVSTTQDTSISEVAGQWMAVPSQPPSWTTDYQTGHFGILSARERADTGYTNTAGDVVFARRYATAPRVVVWITAFDFGVGATWRLNAFPTNIRGRGFTVNVNTWSNTVLYSANVSWVAWPAEDKSVIGNYWHPQVARLNGTGDDVEMAGFGNTSFVSFDKGVSRRMFPELLMGFSQFDVWRGPVGMKLRIENGVRREGTDCTVRSFGNVTLNNNVNLAWLAAT